MIDAVVFDLDGVLIDTEQLWDEVRRDVARDHGGQWTDAATLEMQGMSAPEWSRYMRDVVGIDLPAGEINRIVVEHLLARYRQRLPLVPGAVEAVSRLAERWPLGLASSSDRVIIDEVLRLAGLEGKFQATVSSEQVSRGKPAPDVYLAVLGRLSAVPGRCAAVEDSTNGIRSAVAAGMRVIAVPNRHFPPRPEVLAQSHLVLDTLDGLTVAAVESVAKA